jgi:hypothetical protein
MDDFNVNSLHEARNEWCARLVNILTPLVIDGYKSILDEAVQLCKGNNEYSKYLLVFQNFLSRVPKWNPTIVETERKRVMEKSGCMYLEDLITCVHIIQIKLLTAMRVGQKQKKIDINIPKLDDFIHKVYINVARKIYKNVYLFELEAPALQKQKYNRELEIIVHECILNTIRDSIPVEAILKAYMDETIEEDVTEEVKEQIIAEPVLPQKGGESASVSNNSDDIPNETIPIKTQEQSKLSFNDIDYVRNMDNVVEEIEAPKTIERLQQISEIRANQRKIDEADDDDDEDGNGRIKILDQTAELSNLDLHVIDEPKMELLPDLLIDDIEILD